MIPTAAGQHDPGLPDASCPPGAGGRSWCKHLCSDPACLREIRRGVEQFARDAGFEEKVCQEIALCVNEAVSNVMRHAYHGRRDRPIRLDACCDEGGISLSIRDWGERFDPSTVAHRGYNPLEPGGLGLVCLKRLMDEVKYHPQPEGTLLTMRRSK